MKTTVKVLFDTQNKTFINIEGGKFVPTDTPRTYKADIKKGDVTLIITERPRDSIVFVDAIVTVEDQDFFPIKSNEK